MDNTGFDNKNLNDGDIQNQNSENQNNEIQDNTGMDNQSFHIEDGEYTDMEGLEEFKGSEESEYENITEAAGSNANGGYENQDTLRTSSFYTETLKKPNRTRNVGLLQLVLVALISSIMGGAVVGAFFQFVVPAVQPSAKSFLSSIIPNDNVTSSNDSKDLSGAVKKVDTVQGSDSAVTEIAEKVSPSIVGIRVTAAKAQNFFFFEQESSQPAEGSGIIIKNDGHIMTNYHVIEGALNSSGKMSSGAKIEVILPNQKDKPYAAQLVGGDYKTDLAVLKIDATNLPVVELGNSDDLKVGELAIAIGNPAGLEYMGSVTVGVISGLNRTIPIEDGKELKLIQTDASINPGNSGGALLNSKGQVIGINTAKIGGSGFEGLGFAIPVNKAKEITDSLMQFNYVKGRPLLGIQGDPDFTEDVAKQYNVPMGVLVRSVSPFTGAYKAGILAGDIITKFDGKDVKSTDEINEIKNKHKPGDTVAVEVYRDGGKKTLQVELSEDKGTAD